MTYPELRAIMAKYGVSKSELARVIGNTYQTATKKLNCESEFSFNDILNIYYHFLVLDKDIDINVLFFDWRLTNVNPEAGDAACGD